MLLIPMYLLGLWWFPIFYIAFALTGVALVVGITIGLRQGREGASRASGAELERLAGRLAALRSVRGP